MILKVGAQMKEEILVKLKMRKSYKSILSIIGLLIVLFIVIGVMYLFYDKVLASSIEANGVLSINYVDSKKFNVKDREEIKFSVTNESENITYFYITFNDVNGNGEYIIKHNNENILEGVLNSSDQIKSDYISLDAKETKDYVMEIKGDNKVEGKISVESTKETVVTFADTIIENNNVSSPLTKVGSEAATTDEGLIKSSDDIGISYYFRGNVQNNYVEFANMLWRIVRINGDGTIRLILNDVLEDIGNYYTEDDASFDFRSVNMNKYLNDWLNENLSDDLSYIASTKYCNDIVKDDNNDYMAYIRIMTNKIPTLNCLGESFNTNIGLLTIDEYVLAGAIPFESNNDFYLYNSNIKDPWYTMSGAKGDDKEIYMFMANTNGGILTNIEGKLYRKVRPVINIIRNVEVAGDGTINNPYTIIK